MRLPTLVICALLVPAAAQCEEAVTTKSLGPYDRDIRINGISIPTKTWVDITVGGTELAPTVEARLHVDLQALQAQLPQIVASFGSGGSDCSSDGGLGTSSSISGARLVPEGSTAVLIVDGSATVSACFDSLIPTSRIEMREKDVGLGIKTKVPVVVTAPSGPSRTVLATEAFSARVPIEFFKQGDGYALRAGEIDTTLKNDPSSELARYLGTAVASDVASAAEGSTLSVEPMWAAPPALSGFKATLESASFSDNNGTLSADFGVVLDVPRDSIDEVLKIGVD